MCFLIRGCGEMQLEGCMLDEKAEHHSVRDSSTGDQSCNWYAAHHHPPCRSTRHSTRSPPWHALTHNTRSHHRSYASTNSSSASPPAARTDQVYKCHHHRPCHRRYHQHQRSHRLASRWLRTSSACASKCRRGRDRRRGGVRRRRRCRRWRRLLGWRS